MDAEMYGTRAELNVWFSDRGEDERLAYRIRIDPRCLTINAGLGQPARADLVHTDGCNCGVPLLGAAVVLDDAKVSQ